MSIDTQFLRHHSDVLEYALGKLNLTDPDEVSHDMYGAACLKEFEIVLQQSGSLLRKKPAFLRWCKKSCWIWILAELTASEFLFDRRQRFTGVFVCSYLPKDIRRRCLRSQASISAIPCSLLIQRNHAACSAHA